MYLINKKTFKVLTSVVIFAMMAVLQLTSCSDELLDAPHEYSRNSDGTYGPFDLKISLEAGSADARTRGDLSETIHLNNVWVALFDTATGNLVAMATEKDSKNWEGGETEASSGNHSTSIGEGFAVKTVKNLMINDENTDVYIVGVANYGSEGNEIDVKDAKGNDTSLEQALLNVKTIFDLKDIAVDVISAEKAMKNEGTNCPLLSGVWGKGHGNVSIDNNGNFIANEKNKDTSFAAQLFDKTDLRIKPKYLDEIAGNPIHLRRMYSKIEVTLTHQLQDLSDIQVEIHNIPRYTFLQPHTTIKDASAIDIKEWKDSTANAASKYGVSETFVLDERVTNVSNGRECQELFMNPGDDLTYDDKTKTLKFTYWHYESNHWGLPSVKTMNDREKMYEGSKVYSSLSPKAAPSYNDDAPYFVIKGNVRANNSGSTYVGEASWTIHEGYCCQSDGDASTDEGVISRDFSTFRNTKYIYTVNILGLNSHITKVTSEDMDGGYYHGVAGDLYAERGTRSIEVPEGGISYDLDLPYDQLYWYIISGEDMFGVPLSDNANIQQWYGGSYQYTGEEKIEKDNPFYQSIKLNGQLLGDAVVNPSQTRGAGNNTISFAGTAGLSGMLYLCAIQRSSDNEVVLYSVLEFDQNGKLATPDPQMLKAPGKNNLVMGIDDHTIFWKPVPGAQSYTIELVANGDMGGYKVTLEPNAPAISDGTSKPIDVKLDTETINGTEYLKFRVRYANSAKGMLSFLQKQDVAENVKIRVTANKANGETSDPGEIVKNIYNPVWDFASDSFRGAIKSILGDDNVTFRENESVNIMGLNVNPGTNGTLGVKMKFENTSGLYHIDFGGAGDTGKRNFTFQAVAKFKILFQTSSNGNASSGRHVRIQFSDNSLLDSNSPKANEENSSTNPDANSTGKGTPCNITMQRVDDPGLDAYLRGEAEAPTVYIYPTGNIWMYYIKMTPEDR